MELDFDTVKALSSPTRIAILRQVLEKESTTTQLSRDLEKSKSTVSSHLSTLTEAGLLKKNKVEGRKRVTYHPTDKAQTIVKGRERKVKFSLASSAASAFAGIGLLGLGVFRSLGMKSSANMGESTSLDAQKGQEIIEGGSGGASGDGGMGIMSKGAETAANTTVNATERAANASVEAAGQAPELLQPENVFLFAGVMFLGTSAISFSYAWVMNKLG
jgi:DNA-binding transcriptional ArsR family regulator